MGYYLVVIFISALLTSAWTYEYYMLFLVRCTWHNIGCLGCNWRSNVWIGYKIPSRIDGWYIDQTNLKYITWTSFAWGVCLGQLHSSIYSIELNTKAIFLNSTASGFCWNSFTSTLQFVGEGELIIFHFDPSLMNFVSCHGCNHEWVTEHKFPGYNLFRQSTVLLKVYYVRIVKNWRQICGWFLFGLKLLIVIIIMMIRWGRWARKMYR